MNEALLEFYHNLPPLHQECLDTNVSAQSIRQCIVTHGKAAAYDTASYGGGMTPMHILALNPHANTLAINACFESNMGAVLERFSDGGRLQPCPLSDNTPLEYLAEYDVNSYLSVIAGLCKHREANQTL